MPARPKSDFHRFHEKLVRTKIYTFLARCLRTVPEAMILFTKTWFPWICKKVLLNTRFKHSWPNAPERPQRPWFYIRKHDFHGFARKSSWILDLHILGQMPQNGPRGHDSLYENMISMDLQESAPEFKNYIFLARCPRTAPEAMFPFTKPWFPWISKKLLLNVRSTWPDTPERPERPWFSVRKHDSHTLGQCPERTTAPSKKTMETYPKPCQKTTKNMSKCINNP